MLIKCPECGNMISSEARACPSCGRPAQPGPAGAPVPPPSRGAAPPAARGSMPAAEPVKKSRGWLLGLGCGGVAIVGFIILLGCGGLLGVVAYLNRTQVIVDQTQALKPGQYWTEHFNLKKKARVEVTLEVTSGPAVNCYLMDPKDKQEFDDASRSLLGATFHFTKALSRQGVRSYTETAELEPGEWNYVVDSDAPLIGGDTSSFHVRLVVKP